MEENSYQVIVPFYKESEWDFFFPRYSSSPVVIQQNQGCFCLLDVTKFYIKRQSSGNRPHFAYGMYISVFTLQWLALAFLHETKDPHLAACPRNSPNTWDMIILFTKGINKSTYDLKIKDKVLTLVSIIQEKVFRYTDINQI